jgi:hypothetical protein
MRNTVCDALCDAHSAPDLLQQLRPCPNTHIRIFPSQLIEVRNGEMNARVQGASAILPF